jgi:hypothetical protein
MYPVEAVGGGGCRIGQYTNSFGARHGTDTVRLDEGVKLPMAL